ncbi:amino acid permease [Anaerotignum sp.]
MQDGLEKRYGLLTAIAMVVGIVIGSGVFFKAEKVLVATGGNLPLGILAWFLGGLVMIICAYNFAVMATRYEKVSGVVDYAEVMVGPQYGYYFAWFMATIYFPAMTSVVAWVAARYFCVLMGWDIVGAQAMNLAGLFLIGSYVLNAISPRLAGKFQVATTVIKLIPLLLMALVGTIFGLKNGILVQNFTTTTATSFSGENPLFTAVVGTCFAYEGWICATSINSELKDSQKNLPLALMFGSAFVVLVYMLYYVGLAGAVENEVMMAGGETGAKIAFSTVFTNVGGTLLFVFVVISCLGTLNGLMLACTRGFYAMAARSEGPMPHIFSAVDKVTNMPSNSSVMGLLMAAIWLTYFFGANLTDPWFGPFCFDSSELPIITIYAMYIPIFWMHMRKEKGLGTFNRYIAPILGILASGFMVLAAIISLGKSIIYYMVVFVVLMLIGVAMKNFRHEK